MARLSWILAGGAALAAAFVYRDQRETLDTVASFPPEGETRFPRVTGLNLSRRAFHLPEDFEGELNVAIVAFKQRHQLDVNTWLPAVRDLAARHEGLRYYELPTIHSMNPVARSFIDNGMRAGIPDLDARAATITLYLDKAEFRRALDLPTEDRIYVLLVDREGNVMWRAEGRHSEAREGELRDVVAEVLGAATDEQEASGS